MSSRLLAICRRHKLGLRRRFHVYAPIPHTHGGFGGGLCVEDVAAGEVINSGGGKRPSVRLSGYFVVHLLAGPKLDLRSMKPFAQWLGTTIGRQF